MTSPQFFVDIYHYLKISTPAGRKTINIWKYHIDDGGTKTAARETELKKIRDAAKKNGREIPRTTYQDIWLGKGSPDDIREVLENGVVSGVLKDDREIQEFADENIGVDCGGFVSAYLRYCKIMGDSEGIWHKVGDFRTEPGQIQYRDLLRWYTKDLVVMPKPGHVAIVDTPPYGIAGNGVSPTCSGQMVVCESAGSGIGISTNTYDIRGTVKNSSGEVLFKVDRHLVSFGGTKKTVDANYVMVLPHV